MERKTTSGDSALLIDFSSPISKRILHTPLIPVPNVVNSMSVSPSNSNPFDIIAKQTISSEILDNDPFECASKTTQTNLNNNRKESSENGNNSHLDILEFNEDMKSNENLNMEQELLTDIIEHNCDNRTHIEIEKTNDYFNISPVNKKVTTLQSKSNLLTRCNDSSLSQVSGDFSTEEGIKSTIAKRVNKCIQKVLSNSMIKKKEDSHQSSGLKNNRKSASFTTTTTNNKVCERLNKSCSGPAYSDDSFMNHNLNTPDSSVCSCETPLSYLSGEDLHLNESGILTEKDEIFQEANKLARTFSRIADSFSKNTEGVENDDDLLSCKPQWLYADSSEDEDEKLKKDPALNIRVSFTTPKSQDQPDSDALSAFKTRLRQSFSHLQANDNQIENSFKRSFSFGSKPTIAPVMPTIVSTSVPVILDNHNDNQLKLKKKPIGELRKGPMRAVMPVQNMAKESLTSEVQSVYNRVTSPVRNKNSSHTMVSPIKDVSQMNMCPVASSTPNKCSPATPHIVVPQNKRQSLSSKIDNRKSRNPLVESGPRPRSSSANSGIPTALVPPGRVLGPKSKSNLVKGSNMAKIAAHHEKDSETRLTKPIKSNFNPKALHEVKPKIVQPSRVKSAVNAISKVITGKNKKAATRDKENRFPA